MAKPLFSTEEIAAFERQISELSAKYNNGANKTMSFDAYWTQKTAMENAHKLEEVKRVQQRPEEFLDGLLVFVGSRCTQYVEFDKAFAESDDPAYRKEVLLANTPENRRILFTLLKALTEVPRSWATSAFLRFLRGTGKQKDAKYHGAGTFGTRYGWREDEVKALSEVLTQSRYRSSYASVLMSYADVEAEIEEDDPDYEVVDYDAKFKAVRANRDVAFINRLCDILDAQGLGPVPLPAEEKPKKERKAKQFHSGDIIRKSNLRDLPLPAHIQMPIERLDDTSGQWVASTMQKVVTHLGTGRYVAAIVHSDGKNAFYENAFDAKWGRNKNELEGATFLGEWRTKIPEKKFIQVNFRWRRP